MAKWLLLYSVLACSAYAMQHTLDQHLDNPLVNLTSGSFSAGYVQVRPGAHMFWYVVFEG